MPPRGRRPRFEAATLSRRIAMRVKIDYDLCETTAVCSEVCPEDVLEFSERRTLVVAPEACTNCWICVDNCVSGAIEID